MAQVLTGKLPDATGAPPFSMRQAMQGLCYPRYPLHELLHI